jgi:formylglycine-generating enzyme required for sulfatase activity
MGDKRQIFICYSRKDSGWLERLRTFLKPLEQESELQVFSDQNIVPSTQWLPEIQRAISDSAAAVLLVSQDFLASDFVTTEELPKLLSAANERGLRVFPLFVSTCFLRKDSPLLKFQGVNSPQAPLDTLPPGEQNKVFTRLVESIDELLQVALVGVTEEWIQKFRSKFESVVGGEYLMGDNELASKVHALQEQQVRVDSFKLGRYVVTQSEWKVLMKIQPWLNERNVKYGDDIPAVYVTWHDAVDFVRAINGADPQFSYRLPTEAEWEYAARGGVRMLQRPRTRFCFGDDPNQLISHGWHDQNASLRGDNYAHPVGMLSPNPLNLFDMHGNIWEWMADNVDGLRVLRGGGFDFSAEGACSVFRVVTKSEFKSQAAGFRLVQEPKR